MEITSRCHITLRDPSHIGEARRCTRELAESLDESAELIGNISIVVTEIATNLIKHAKQGEIIAQLLGGEHGPVGLEILGIDRGPGITNIGLSMKDGYSTVKGSAGIGLGAIQRLASEFELHSTPENGTALLTRFFSNGSLRKSENGCRDSSITIPKTGQSVCGDGIATAYLGDITKIMVVDGVGHGSFAAEASRLAIKAFHASSMKSPSEILHEVDQALKNTRGAAAAVAQIDRKSSLATYAGVGNIASALWTPVKRQNLVSHNGTLGRSVHRISEFQYALGPNATLIMHSDGLSSHWNLDQYPGLPSRDPLLIAGVLYRDHKKEYDDTSIAVLKTFDDAA